MKEIEWIGENRFDFVDLFLEEDEAVPEKIDTEKVLSSLRTYGLGVVGHTAWYLPIGSPMRSLRKSAIEELVKYFEVFSQLRVEFVTIHADWPSHMFSREEGIGFQVESLVGLVEEAKRNGLKIMYEPTDTPDDNINNVSEVLQRVPECFLHLDIGHANLFGRKPERFIKRFHEKIRHIHLHDNARDMDLHLPIGCGNIDWEKTLRILKRYYDGTITLEVFSKDRDYILLSKEKLRKMWDNVQ